MSMTGSLMGYENNNEVNQAKCSNKKPGLKQLPVLSSVNSSGVTTTNSKTRRNRNPPKRESCTRGHVNSLWSVWYGIGAVAIQAYIATRCAKRFIAYLSLPWPTEAPPPRLELHACLVLAGTGVLLLPVLLAAAFFKLGNLANDGIKLGRHLSACTRDPPSSLINSNQDNGLATNLWRHGGPTAAFIHLCTAMCFLLPSLLMEARLIHAGFLPKEAIWRTDLDWVVIHEDRLVVLSFMNPPGNLSTLSGFITPQPYVTSTLFDDDMESIVSSTSEIPNTDEISETEPQISSTVNFRAIFLGVTKPPNDSTAPKSKTTVSAFSNTSTSTAKVLTTSSISSTSTSTTPPIITSMETTMKEIFNTTTSILNSKITTKGNFLPKKLNATKIVAKNGTVKAKAKQKVTAKSTTSKPTKPTKGNNMTAESMALSMNSLADLDRPENLNLEFNSGESYGPITLEYLNYAMALAVYSVRYPAVFWSCNKALGTIFSLQLLANSAQSLLAYAGMSVLYKVQVMGPLKVLPMLRHRTISTTSTISTFLGDSYFLLNPHVTLALFALSSLLVLCSSMVMYLYAHGRFTSFLNQERERRVILLKEGRDGNGWGYFTHCVALCVFLAISICSAPLLYDYTVVYRGSLDGAVLACIISTVLHLFLWLILWIFLTIKQKWIFKLRVTIGRATVRSARSVKLVTDVDLLSARDDEDGTNAPLLVLGNGRTYTIADNSPKKAIMSVIQKAAMERKARAQGGNSDSVDGESNADGDEQIYWLRPKLRPSPAQSPTDGSSIPQNIGDKGWLNKKLKPKVTFNDLPSTSGARNKGKARRGIGDGGPDDDGDYATLRELPLMSSVAHDPADDSNSEENKLLECVNDDHVTYYASGNRDLQPSEGDPSPLLTPEPLPDPPPLPIPLPLPLPPSSPEQTNNHQSNSNSEIVNAPLINTNTQINIGQTPRCLRRADSGMPHEELTPRSDFSNSPPLVDGGSTVHSNTSSHSETSSGVHSNASNASNTSQSSSQRRATSVEDLSIEPREEPQWRSCSLQRGVQPPTSSSSLLLSKGTFSPPNTRPGTSQSFSTPQYVNHTPLINVKNQESILSSGCPAIILENPNESTVVIRRKLSRPKLIEPLLMNPNEEPFGRSTNMRMTSFTENNADLRSLLQSSSATLPHYPTQPLVSYPHCSTMPLPHSTTHNINGSNNSVCSSNGNNNNINNLSNAISAGGGGGGVISGAGSCGSVSRHLINTNNAVASNLTTASMIPSHTTLPSHLHNGVRLLQGSNVPGSGAVNPFVKRFPHSVQLIHSNSNSLQQQQQNNWNSCSSSSSSNSSNSLLSHGHHTFSQQHISKLINTNNSSSNSNSSNSSNSANTATAIAVSSIPIITAAQIIRQSDRDSANFSMASSGDSDTCLPH